MKTRDSENSKANTRNLRIVFQFRKRNSQKKIMGVDALKSPEKLKHFRVLPKKEVYAYHHFARCLQKVRTL